jgi:hypothetical protein
MKKARETRFAGFNKIRVSASGAATAGGAPSLDSVEVQQPALG